MSFPQGRQNQRSARRREPISRWRLRFFVVFGIAALLGCLSLFVLPIQYRAQAVVMVGSRETNPLASQQVVREPREQELDVDGEIQLLTSPPP
jgi:uncharacterized protein involved in exopolysaccharide biosynthesis